MFVVRALRSTRGNLCNKKCSVLVYTILVAHRGNIHSHISRSAFRVYMSQHKDRKKDERAIYRMPVLKSLKKIKSSKRGLLQQ